jgi:hypothetical protein
MADHKNLENLRSLFYNLQPPTSNLQHPNLQHSFVSCALIHHRPNMRFRHPLLLFFICMACQQEINGYSSATPVRDGFETVPLAKPVLPGKVDEASGIADSKANPGYLWVEQDSGNPRELLLLSHNGEFLKKIYIKPAFNRDWEDMALGNGPADGKKYIYVGDIGDNNLAFSTYAIYRFEEPTSTTDTVFSCDKISFVYPDGAHDAEAMLVDDQSKDIYIITKRDNPSRVYKIAYPQSTNTVNTAVPEGSLGVTAITGAAVSPDGRDILLRTYLGVMRWKRNNGQSLVQALMTTPDTLTTQLEPQGEALCFKNDNSGFFSLSEKPFFASGVNLNFYKRK